MRRVLPVLLACAAVPFAAGCGAEKSVKNAVDPVAQAATRTEAAGTIRLAINGSVSTAGTVLPIQGTGVFDVKGRRGDMHVTTSVPGKGQVEIEELLDGFVLYMRSDALTASLPGGKHWLRLDLQALARKQGVDFGQLQQLGGGTDPTQWLAYLKQTSRVEKIGSEEIEGRTLTHYRATSDLDKIASSNPDAAAGVRQVEKLTGRKTLPTDVWVDGDGLIRRQTIDYSVKQPTAARMQMTLDYQRFGVPLNMHTPSAGDTIDLTDVIGA